MFHLLLVDFLFSPLEVSSNAGDMRCEGGVAPVFPGLL
jgi:hypothetical protein